MEYKLLSLLVCCLCVTLGHATYNYGVPFVTSPLSSAGGLIGVGSGQAVGSLPTGGAPILGGYQGLYSSAAVPYGVSAGPYSMPSGPLATDVAQGGLALPSVIYNGGSGLPSGPLAAGVGYIGLPYMGASVVYNAAGYQNVDFNVAGNGVSGLSGGADVYGSGAYGTGAYGSSAYGTGAYGSSALGRVSCFQVRGSYCPVRSWYAGSCGGKKKKCKLCCMRICHPKEPCYYGTGAYGSGAYGIGAYGNAAYGTGAYGTGAYGNAIYGAGAYGNAALGSGAYGTAAYGIGAYGTEAYGTGAYGSGAYGTGAYGSGAYGTGAYGSGAYGTGAYGTGTYGTGAYGIGTYRTGAYGTGAYGTSALGRVSCFQVRGSYCPARSWYAGNCGSKKNKCKICCRRICHPKEPCNYY